MNVDATGLQTLENLKVLRVSLEEQAERARHFEDKLAEAYRLSMLH